MSNEDNLRKVMWGNANENQITRRDGSKAGVEQNYEPTVGEIDPQTYEDSPWLAEHPDLPEGKNVSSYSANPFSVIRNATETSEELLEENEEVEKSDAYENGYEIVKETSKEESLVPTEDVLGSLWETEPTGSLLPAETAPNDIVINREEEKIEEEVTAEEDNLKATRAQRRRAAAASAALGENNTIVPKDENALENMFEEPEQLPETSMANNTPFNPGETNELAPIENPVLNNNYLLDALKAHDPTPAETQTLNDIFETEEKIENVGMYADADRSARLKENKHIIEQIRQLGQSGDTGIQSVIRSFTLTSDPDLDAQQLATYRHMLSEKMSANKIYIPVADDFELISQTAYDELLGLGPLGPLWRDENIADIMVTGPKKVGAEKNGKLISTNIEFDDVTHLQSVARTLSMKVDDRGASRSNPVVTAQLPGARVQIMWDPVAVSGCSVVIRKHRRLLTLPDLLASNALNDDIAALIAEAVTARASILVSGSTGSGKTTWLNIASGFIPDSERVLVLEDARELKLTNTNVEYLLTKERASADDPIVIGLDLLLDGALRMRPDRILVGEIIKPPGAAAMLEAAYTGHDGTMTTIHANSGADGLDRMARLLKRGADMPIDMAIQQVWDTFDLLIHVERNDLTGKRYVASVTTPEKVHKVNTLFTGKINKNGEIIFNRPEKLRADTALAKRLLNAGADLAFWEDTK